MKQEYVSICMIRRELKAIPDHPLPSPFSFEWYRPGDEVHWLEIQRRADQYNQITPALFERQFGNDAQELARRQCFILDGEDGEARPIGTATAWFDPDYQGQEYGRVHWVAIVPEMQGRGLANPLLTVICQRLRELGHEQAYLTTAPERIPAINLYLKFGFVPEVRSEVELRAWKGIEAILGRTLLQGVVGRD
jgi:GNAT superfamily N-acetyltransferase